MAGRFSRPYRSHRDLRYALIRDQSQSLSEVTNVRPVSTPDPALLHAHDYRPASYYPGVTPRAICLQRSHALCLKPVQGMLAKHPDP